MGDRGRSERREYVHEMWWRSEGVIGRLAAADDDEPVSGPDLLGLEIVPCGCGCGCDSDAATL